MIAVIFEVEPRDGKREAYLDIAAELRPLLEQDRRIHIHRTVRKPDDARQGAVAVLLPR